MAGLSDFSLRSGMLERICSDYIVVEYRLACIGSDIRQCSVTSYLLVLQVSGELSIAEERKLAGSWRGA